LLDDSAMDMLSGSGLDGGGTVATLTILGKKKPKR
jgi:hypothetical protein